MSDVPPFPTHPVSKLSRPELVAIIEWCSDHQVKLNDEITALRVKLVAQAEEFAAQAEERRLTLLNISAQLDRFHAQSLDAIHQRDVIYEAFKFVVRTLELLNGDHVPDRLSALYHQTLSRAKQVVAHIESLKRS